MADSWENSDHFLEDGSFSYYEFHNNPGGETGDTKFGEFGGFDEGEGLPEFHREKKKHGKRPPKRAKYFITAGANGSFRFDTFIRSQNSGTNILGGVTGSLRFGLLGPDFDWSIEQQFGHIWGLKICDGSSDMMRYDASTFIEMSQSRPLRHHFSLNYTLGIGLLYNMPHSGQPGSYGDDFAIDDSGTNLAVSFKLAVGFIWYYTHNQGLGLNLNYMMGLDIASYLSDKAQNNTEIVDVEGSSHNRLLVEMLQPGLVWIVKF